jgi:hypothetical protein
MASHHAKLDLSLLQVESFDTSAVYEPEIQAVWGSGDTQCDLSACNSKQRTACESTDWGSCGSYWPNCNVSRGCPV